MTRPAARTKRRTLRGRRDQGRLITICGIVILSWHRSIAGSAGPSPRSAKPRAGSRSRVVVVAYVALVRIAAQHPDLPLDDPTKAFIEVPDFYETARTGLHYLLPVIVLIWCLMVEEMSPGLAAFWGVVAMGGVVLTQRPLTAFFRSETGYAARMARRAGAISSAASKCGARNMTAVGIATATAGIIVGTVTLTGIGLVMTEIVEFLSGGNRS